MSEDKEGTENRRRHLNPDELPGRPFDEQGKDDEAVGVIKKKKSLFAGFIPGWISIASQRLFPPKREPM